PQVARQHATTYNTPQNRERRLSMQYTPADVPQEPSGAKSVLTGGRKLAIIGAILLAAFAYFGYTAFMSATAFYLTVDEFVERGPVVGESVQIKGQLVDGTFAREGGNSLAASFLLEENGAQVDAAYDGVLPDLFFNPHSEIVLGGTYTEEGVFLADRVYVKCPSKYQELEVENPYDDVAGG
ncbi:MAG: cytochrome c maturation protein CcmE, partial [Dehalococcoidia bacterium]